MNSKKYAHLRRLHTHKLLSVGLEKLLTLVNKLCDMSRMTDVVLDMLGSLVSLFPFSFTMFTDGNCSKKSSVMCSV